MSGYTHIDDGSVVVGAGPFYRSGGVGIPDGKQQLVSPKKEIDGKARSGCLFCTLLGLSSKDCVFEATEWAPFINAEPIVPVSE